MAWTWTGWIRAGQGPGNFWTIQWSPKGNSKERGSILLRGTRWMETRHPNRGQPILEGTARQLASRWRWQYQFVVQKANNKNSVMGVFWKCARIGERLSPYISLCCVIMAVCENPAQLSPYFRRRIYLTLCNQTYRRPSSSAIKQGKPDAWLGPAL